MLSPRVAGRVLQVETLPCPVRDGAADTEALRWVYSGRGVIEECWMLAIYYVDDGHPQGELSKAVKSISAHYDLFNYR